MTNVIKIEELKAGTKILVKDSDIVLSEKVCGIWGRNGVGKTTLMNHIAFRTNSCMVVQELKNSSSLIEEILSSVDNILDIDEESAIAKKILHGLGFKNSEFYLPTELFSGGKRMRIALSKALYRSRYVDVLLLDEPTNHLDLESVIWLVEYIKNSKNKFVIISHDSEFLDQICEKILYFENQKVLSYKGKYSSFKHFYEKELVSRENKRKRDEKQVKEMLRKGRREEAQKFLLKNKPIEKEKRPFIRINFGEKTVREGVLCEMKNLDFSYDEGKLVLKNLTFSLNSWDKFGIVGKNGCGKTTFLKILHKTLAEKFSVGYYEQILTKSLPQNISPVHYLSQKHSVDFQTVREFLGRIGIESKSHMLNIGELSGGQKSRLVLCDIQISSPSILLLDKPTNHLDEECIESLLSAVKDFKGPVVFITHNLRFLKDFDILEVDDGKIFPTSLDDYCQKILTEQN